MVSGLGERHAFHGFGQARGKRLDFGESGSDLENVDDINAIYVLHRRHNPERFVNRLEVWDESRLEGAGG